MRKRILTSQINKIKPNLFIHNCNRCGHEWAGKLETPNTCANPKCRTPYWNKPRIRKQNKIKSPVEKFYFYFEGQSPNQTYSFAIIDGEIICNECNIKTCNHVFEIMTEPKIRKKIAKQGIEFLPLYEMQIQELEKNINTFKEFVEN